MGGSYFTPFHPGWEITIREDSQHRKVRSTLLSPPLSFMPWVAHLPKGYVTAPRAILHHYMVTEVGYAS